MPESAPEQPTPSRRRAIVATAAVAIVAAAGVGGYLIGRSSGQDLEAVRAAGASAGKAAAARDGREEGYAQGLRLGRKRGYEAAFPEAYRAAYARQFRAVEVDAPTRIVVPESANGP